MLSAWWQKVAMQRMTRAARTARLRVEPLEARDVPAGIFAVGAAPGDSPVIGVFDAGTGQRTLTINAYETNIPGGVRVAVGDVNGDGTADVITGAGVGGGPQVNVFDGANGSRLGSFTVGDADSRAGVSVAAADFDGDGKADIVAGAVRNGQPYVRILKGTDGSTIREFSPFSGAAGISVATGDFNGDGKADVAVGVGAGDAPRVVVLDGTSSATLLSKFAFETTFTGGVSVAMGDLNADGKAEVITAAGFLGGPRVQAFTGGTGAVFQNFFAFNFELRNGVFVSAYDANGDGKLDIVTQSGTGQPMEVKSFDGRTLAALASPTNAGLPVGGASSDTVKPTVTVTAATPGPTGTSPLSFTVTFSEAVNGFTASDVTVTNGTVANVTAQSGSVYTVAVTPSGSGAVTVSVAAGVATDGAGNANTASNTATTTFDAGAPTVTLTSPLPNPTNTSPLTFTAEFSEAVTGFDSADDLTVVNGTASNPIAISSTKYTFVITPDGQGDVTVVVKAGAAQDTAGNGNTVSAGITRTFDTTAPLATIGSTAPANTTTAPIPFSVTFSEGIAESTFVPADLTVTNGTVTDFTRQSETTYSFNVIPTGDGAVTVSLEAGKITDPAGNANTASNSVTRTFTGTGPAATVTALTTADNTPTLSGTVATADATVQVSVNGRTYTATVLGTNWTTPIPDALPDGTYDVRVIATAGGNSRVTLAPGVLVVDSSGPVPTVSSTGTGATNVSPISYIVTFSENVDGFDKTDVTVTNGSIDNFLATDGKTYTFQVTPTGQGAVGVSVAASKVTDSLGNPNVASNTLTRVFDTAAPAAPVITGLAAASDGGTVGDGRTNDATPTITGTGEVEATVTVRIDGTVSGTATVGADGKWAFTPAADLSAGDHTVTATQADAAGNTSGPTANFTVAIDTTAPVPVVTSSASEPTNASPIPFEINFGESVLGFTASDLGAVNGTVGNFVDAGNGKFTFVVTPSGSGVTVLVSVPAGNVSGVTDVAGNASAVSNTVSRTFNSSLPPAPIITGLAAESDSGVAGDGRTNDTTPTITGTGEAAGTVTVMIDGVEAGTAIVAGDGTWTVTPTTAVAAGSHTVTASLTRAAGGTSGTSAGFALVIDTTGPAPALTTPENPTNDSPFTVTVDFGETVTGFDKTDLLVTNGTAGTATDIGNGKFTVPITPTGPGTVEVQLAASKANDLAGNPNTAATALSVMFDTTAPGSPAVTGLITGSDTGFSDTDEVTSDTTPTLTGTADSGTTVELFAATGGGAPQSLGTVAVGTGETSWNFTPASALVNGTYTVTAVAKDAAGNLSPASAPVTVVIDTTDPTATVAAAATGAITGTAADTLSGVHAVAVSISNGSAFWDGNGFDSPTEVFLDATSSDNFATWSVTAALPNGVVTVNARATDAAGNEFSVTQAVQVGLGGG